MGDADRLFPLSLENALARRQFLKLGATTAGMLALAACGAEGSPSPSGASGPNFKVGFVAPFTKVYAPNGQDMYDGFIYGLEKLNYTGGNRKIVVLKEDEEDNANNIAVTRTRKLVEQDNVDMIAGYIASPSALNSRDLLDQNQIPTLVANAGANALSRARKSRFIFRTSFSNWQPNQPMGKYVADKISKKVLLVNAKYSAGIEQVGGFEETFVPAGGQITGRIEVPWPTTTDFQPFLTQIQRANPEAIYVFFSGVDAIKFLQQANQLNSLRNIKVAGSGYFVEEDVLRAIGDAAPVGAITGLHWASTLENKENKDFVAGYKKRYNNQPSVFSLQGYDTARVIVEALNKTKGDSKNKDAFLAAIRDVTFKSPRGDFKFDPLTNNVIQTIYVRELVKDSSGRYVHRVLASFPGVADPGR
jgi:branched-chain amino acid transport system substrate-binding protein